MQHSKDLDYDVIIAGAGPAGTTCALTFQDPKIKVLVIDKSTFPREKVCGDGIAPYVPKVLARIHEKYAKAFYEMPNKFSISECLLRSYNGKTAFIDLPESFYIATRYHFDNFLYEQARTLPNVDFLLNETIKEVEVSEESARVKTKSGKQLSAKLLIACDGASSIIRRTLTSYKLNPEQNWAALRAYFSGVTGFEQHRFEIYFSKKYPHGYFWVFPSFDGAVNVGVGTTTQTVSSNKLDLKKLLYDILEEHSDLKERFKNAQLIEDIKGWGIPCDFGDNPISGQRFMLCGDAGSMADPATGEGIGPAMVSGRIAGFFASKCFEQNDFSAAFMKGYERDIEKKYGKLMRSRKKMEGFYSSNFWAMNTFVNVLNQTKTISKKGQKTLLKVLG